MIGADRDPPNTVSVSCDKELSPLVHGGEFGAV